MTRRGVWYPGESLFLTLKFEYLSEISTKIEKYFNPLIGDPDWFKEEKNWRLKILLDCPFNKNKIENVT